MATIELDFLGLEKTGSASKSQFQKFLHRHRSFTGIQGTVSKIDPQLLKTVIESGSSHVQNQKQNQNSVSVPIPKPAVSEISGDSAPLTIFYNGVIAVYDLPRDQADSILKLAVEGNGRAVGSADRRVSVASTEQKLFLERLNNGDLPIFRKKSLQRFMEKRKERLICASPYGSPI